MNWKPTHGKKPDLPDNQSIQTIGKDGTVFVQPVEDVAFWEDEPFYRTHPILLDDNDFTPIINNLRPEGLHDKDEIEVIYYDGNSSIDTFFVFLWGATTSYKKLFYRLTKKYEEPKPKRVGELMALEEWISTCTEIGQVTIRAYVDYIEENIKNDR